MDQPTIQSTQLLMSVLENMTGANGSAVFVATDRQARLIASAGVGQDAIDRVKALASFGQPDGYPILKPGWAIYAFSTSDSLSIVFYVNAPKYQPELNLLESFRLSLQRAFAGVSPEKPRADRSQATLNVDITREMLVHILNVSEWNLAFAARRIGKSRMTMYRLMERFGIERKHQSKPKGYATTRPQA